MSKGRLEAFSDGVLAIIITIMVLEMRAPRGEDISVLLQVAPKFASYVLSFIHLGIYWNNHHHLLHTLDRVSGGILWANLHLLFWLSLVPFSTAWLGENQFAAAPTMLYGVVLLASAVAYFVLQQLIIRRQGEGSVLRQAIGSDWKGKLSPLLYATGIALGSVARYASLGCYIAVALIWLIPDRRIERILAHHSK